MNLKIKVRSRISETCIAVSEKFRMGKTQNRIVKDRKCDWVAFSRIIFNRSRNQSSHLGPLKVHGVNGIGQTDMHTAELLVTEPQCL